MLYRLTVWVDGGRIKFFIDLCQEIIDYLDLMISSFKEYNDEEKRLLSQLRQLLRFLEKLNHLLPKEAQQ